MARKAFIIPQTVPKRPINTEAEPTVARTDIPRSALAISRFTTRFMTLSMRCCEDTLTASVFGIVLLSSYSRIAAAKTRAIGSRVSPASPLDSSSKVLPDQKVSSKAVARRFNRNIVIALSTAMPQDQKLAATRMSITALTTQSARVKRYQKEKSPLWTGSNAEACMIKSIKNIFFFQLVIRV